MKRNHIRSYRITDHGDVEVVDWRGGEEVDISSHYESVARDRRGMRCEASLDIFRFQDGQLSWSASPNGHDIDAAVSLGLLLDVFLEDLGPMAAPRSF